MKRIKDNSVFLKATTTSHPEQCKALLQSAKQSQLDSICEIILNIVRGTITLKDELFAKAKRYRKVLRELITKCGNKKTMVKCWKIIQKLIATALPVIGLVLSGLQVTNSLS